MAEYQINIADDANPEVLARAGRPCILLAQTGHRAFHPGRRPKSLPRQRH